MTTNLTNHSFVPTNKFQIKLLTSSLVTALITLLSCKVYVIGWIIVCCFSIQFYIDEHSWNGLLLIQRSIWILNTSLLEECANVIELGPSHFELGITFHRQRQLSVTKNTILLIVVATIYLSVVFLLVDVSLRIWNGGVSLRHSA